MADKTTGELPAVKVGSLPLAPDIFDDTLIPVEQDGVAKRISGEQWKGYATVAVDAQVARAETAAGKAEKSATDAAGSVDVVNKSASRAEAGANRADAEADRAEKAREAIENLTVTAKTLLPGEEATVTKTLLEGFVNLLFGIPRGLQGATGPKGEQGIQGERGLQGPAGVVAQMMGLYAFHVNEEGHLILTYDDSSDPPHFELRENGHLYYIFEEAA